MTSRPGTGKTITFSLQCEFIPEQAVRESCHKMTHPLHPDMASRSGSTQGPPSSGLWRDISAIVSSRDASVMEENSAGIPANESLKMLEEKEGGPEPAVVYWAVVLLWR